MQHPKHVEQLHDTQHAARRRASGDAQTSATKALHYKRFVLPAQPLMDYIRLVQRTRGLSIVQVARIAGTTPRTLHRYFKRDQVSYWQADRILTRLLSDVRTVYGDVEPSWEYVPLSERSER